MPAPFDHSDASSDAPPVDRATAHVGIVCTQAGEIAPLLAQLDRRRSYTEGSLKFSGGFLGEAVRVAVAEAGSGFATHRRATEILVAEHQPTWVISAGYSSSLADDIHGGDLSLATSICDTHGQKIDVNCPIPESTRVTARPHVVADAHPATSSDRRQLAEQWQAAAVDTGSLAVAQICRDTQTRFLSIRAIINDVAAELPQEVHSRLFAPDPQRRRPLSGRLMSRLRQPAEVREWHQKAQAASERLARFLSGVIAQLGEKLL